MLLALLTVTVVVSSLNVYSCFLQRGPEGLQGSAAGGLGPVSREVSARSMGVMAGCRDFGRRAARFGAIGVAEVLRGYSLFSKVQSTACFQKFNLDKRAQPLRYLNIQRAF